MIIKKLIALSLGLMLTLGALCGCAVTDEIADTPDSGDDIVEQSAAPEETPEVNTILSTFSAVDIEGNAVDESVLEGYKLSMVNVWGTYCGPCITEMPYLGELSAEYAERGFRIIGIVVDAGDMEGNSDAATVEKAKELVEETGADYLHVLPGQGMEKLFSGMQYIPTTVFVNEKGEQVGEVYVGSMNKQQWAGLIEELLALVEN